MTDIKVPESTHRAQAVIAFRAPIVDASAENSRENTLLLFPLAPMRKDHGGDRGVAYGTRFGEGFTPESYPETTGYIICTFLELAKYYKNDEYLFRAVEMGEWESAIQMPSGAVMGGIYNTKPTPAVFNTGMVPLGWAVLFRETGSRKFLESGERAGKWLLEVQETDGNSIRGNSNMRTQIAPSTM